MMTTELVAKSLRDNRGSTFAWGLVLVASVLLQMAVYPTVKQAAGDFEQLLANYPEAFKAMFGVRAEFTSGAGYVQAEVFGFLAPLVLLGIGIGHAARATAAEEQSRTMDLLLANPLSRTRLLLHKALAVLVDLIVVGVALAVVLVVGTRVVNLDVPVMSVVTASLLCALLAMPFAAVALLVGALTGRRGLAIAISAGAAVLAFLTQTLGELADWLRPWRVLSPFHHAAIGDTLDGRPDITGAVVLVAVTGALLFAAVLAFERRDIAT